MAETSEDLIETPRASADPLSDVLDSMHLSGTVLFRADFREPWSVATPDSVQLARTLPFRTEHLIPFHVVTEGGCWLNMREQSPVWLKAGDAVLLPYGDMHHLYGRESTRTVHVGQLLPAPPWNNMLVIEHGGSGGTTSILCGFVQCDELLFHPVLRHLPALLHASPQATSADSWLASTIRQTADEASNSSPGARSMLPRLTELMFVEILRKHMQNLSAAEVGWFAAFRDPVAGRALKCLHDAPFHDWDVTELARRVGVSRTVLAERFKHLLEQPPMKYLARWRLQLTAHRLKNSDLRLKAIAEQGGYESEAAFSRAFKRHFGCAPGDWRKRQGPKAQTSTP
jgi:AraC family transcriptional regulator, alkane utilization regulator